HVAAFDPAILVDAAAAGIDVEREFGAAEQAPITGRQPDAVAAGLLVAGEQDDDVAAGRKSRRLQPGQRRDDGDDAGLVVVGPAAKIITAVLPEGEWVVLPVGRLGIDD